jgi:NADH:ubiquinone oxidoreductase subunit H
LDFGWKRLVPLTLILFLLVVFAREAVVCHG